MQGTIKILDGEEKKIASYINENTITSEPYCEIHSSSMNFSSFIERGEYLYKRKGCISCHGNNGKGGVYNPNYVNKFIPRLDELADKMKIYSKDDADTMIKLLESKVDLESLEDNPPIENYTRILAQYNSVCNKILDGSSSLQKLDTDGPKPPLDMPAWEGQLSEEDINQIIAYLITQYPWEKYE
jgi:cytochrome c553